MKLTSFNDTDLELENALAKATKNLISLQQQYKDLEEKFDRFKYLETVVSDNGVIEKEYHITKDIVVDEHGKWKKETDVWCDWCCHPFKLFLLDYLNRTAERVRDLLYEIAFVHLTVHMPSIFL
jgi:hypothetical protein